MKIRATIVTLLMLSGTSIHAQEGIYVGLGFGNFDYEEGFDDVFYGRVSDTATAQKIYGGFELNQYVGLEFSYLETGDLKATGTSVVPPFGEVNGSLKLDFNIITLRVMGRKQLSWATLMGGVGFYSSENDFDEVLFAVCCGADRNAATIDDNGLTAQVGLEWRWGRFGEPWGLRVEYEFWDISDIDTANIGLGLSFGF